MKYAIVIPDGCADEPQASLGGKTPLQAARTPNMDRIARTGYVGSANNVPPGLTPASDVATLSLFGYDPLEVYTGRSPLEAAAMGIQLGPNDWAIRCNLVNIDNGEMRDFTAGHISSPEGSALLAAIDKALSGPVPGGTDRLEFHAGVSYRNCLVYRTSGTAPFGAQTKTQPPHDIPDQPIGEYLPSGPGSELLRLLMDRSREVLGQHPVNVARKSSGKRPATQIWLWGQGRAPSIQLFAERYGKRGAIISGVDLVRGVGILLGWKRIDVPGVTDYLDNDYAAQGRATIEALRDYDIVCAHVESPDEASHEGKAEEKVKALEEIDRHIVGPLLEAMPTMGDWRILVSPDHRTPLRTRAHAHGAVPFAIAGTGVAAKGQPSYDEAVAAQSDVALEHGHALMRRFLG
ncbi:MAG: cofactor-independent phosphoglycerate mutase [Gemmataceae bacterium]|nr:cofactor-independent phosphoglycerate mutase [Gemmataceae bacterium]